MGDEAGYLESNSQDLLDTSPTYTAEGDSICFDYKYRAPESFVFENNYMTQKLRQVKARIEINHNNIAEPTVLEQLIDIIRPPVLMVHGLNDTSNSFAKMGKKLQTELYDPFQIYSLDYSSSNTASFAENKQVVPSAIDILLKKVRSYEYEVNKVDVVGHSMGGLLTRQYVQSDYYKDDVNRLITLNTPHSGSQGANLLMQMDQYADWINASLYTFYLSTGLRWNNFVRDKIYNEFTHFVRQGAVRDLCVDSEAIEQLNAYSNFYKYPIKIHTLYTTTEYHSYSILKNSIETLITSYLNFLRLTSFALYKEDNDLVVAQSSQIGGFLYPSFVPDQNHLSTNNDSVINRVKYLLNSPNSNNNLFQDYFYPPQLNYNLTLRSSSLRNSSQDAYIKFVSINNQNCMSNDEIRIQITGSSDITSMSLLVQGEDENIYMETKEGSNNEFSYTVPEEAIGYKKILAIGFTGSQTMVIDTASINVSTLASLLSITTSPENETWVPLNGKQPVQVLGLYSDSTTKNISYLNDVQFMIKGSNAGLEAPNTILGLKEGVDTLVVSCQGLEISLPIQIIDVGLEATAIETPEAKVQKTLNCYPNPAKEQITIAYELPESCSFATLNVYDTKGQLMKTIELKNKTAGYHEEVIPIGNISKGVYIVVLSTDTGNSYLKLLKE